jgi:hypothetical protein
MDPMKKHLTLILTGSLLVSLARAQSFTETFSAGNPDLWGVDFIAVAAHLSSGGNPGACIRCDVSSGSAGTFPVPAAASHPWRGNFRALGVTAFQFDRAVESGTTPLSTSPTLLLASDNGTRTDISDDTWAFVWTGDTFQGGAWPWTTVSIDIPSASWSIPQGFTAGARPNSPNAGIFEQNTLWNFVIQDVDYIGISMSTPWNPNNWQGGHTLLFDDFTLVTAGLGTAYCAPAALNSTGAPGTLVATGSSLVSANSLRLTGSSLPRYAFGSFLTSRTQDFVPNALGSQGNLCLGGAVGRFSGTNNIQNSGASGVIALQINLLNLPQPISNVVAQAGETWNFQAWYRDAVGGSATSNFTTSVAVTFE